MYYRVSLKRGHPESTWTVEGGYQMTILLKKDTLPPKSISFPSSITIWSKLTLICSCVQCVGELGRTLLLLKRGTTFLMLLEGLVMNFDTILCLCPMIFFLKIGTLRAKGIRKRHLIRRRRVCPFPAHTIANECSFTSYRGKNLEALRGISD